MDRGCPKVDRGCPKVAGSWVPKGVIGHSEELTSLIRRRVPPSEKWSGEQN